MAEGAGEIAAATERVLADREMAVELGRRARRHVLAHHSWADVARRYEDLYLELVGSRPNQLIDQRHERLELGLLHGYPEVAEPGALVPRPYTRSVTTSRSPIRLGRHTGVGEPAAQSRSLRVAAGGDRPDRRGLGRRRARRDGEVEEVEAGRARRATPLPVENSGQAPAGGEQVLALQITVHHHGSQVAHPFEGPFHRRAGKGPPRIRPPAGRPQCSLAVFWSPTDQRAAASRHQRLRAPGVRPGIRCSSTQPATSSEAEARDSGDERERHGVGGLLRDGADGRDLPPGEGVQHPP